MTSELASQSLVQRTLRSQRTNLSHSHEDLLSPKRGTGIERAHRHAPLRQLW